MSAKGSSEELLISHSPDHSPEPSPTKHEQPPNSQSRSARKLARKMSSNTPLLGGTTSPTDGYTAWRDEDARKDPAFYSLVGEGEAAIDNGIQPILITQGSSGSYFVRDAEQSIIGVFKPKDEEPYGIANPKWQKYFQRKCCPCMFGRGCILPMQGYISEAAASMVDSRLGLNIVPKTKVVPMASPAFHYTGYSRIKTKAVQRVSEKFPSSVGKRLRQGLPPKIGSFQTFVHGYKDAADVYKSLDLDLLEPGLRADFHFKFECLVVLDFIIRNTDRGMDNWLIKHTRGSSDTPALLEVAAIDNGLAFPFKHPDDWRAYPYQWAYIPQAKIPFSERICTLLLPFVSDDDQVESLVEELHGLFMTDSGFTEDTFEKQMGVMRGQIVNLREALRVQKSPLELVKMPSASIVVHRQRADENGPLRKYRQIVAKKLPFFRNW